MRKKKVGNLTPTGHFVVFYYPLLGSVSFVSDIEKIGYDYSGIHLSSEVQTRSSLFFLSPLLNYQGILTFGESGVKSVSGIQGQKVAIVHKALSRASCWCQGLKNKADLCASLICDLRVSAYLLTEAQDTQG